jgi:hypothetical protein
MSSRVSGSTTGFAQTPKIKIFGKYTKIIQKFCCIKMWGCKIS